MPNKWAGAARLLRRGAEFFCALLFALVFAAFCYKIVRRYAAGDAVAWADELSVVLFIWIIFIANAFVVEDRRQITFDLIFKNLSARSQRIAETARIILVGGIFLAALPGAVDYTLFLWRERTPVMLWRLDYVYACFAVFMAAVLVRMGPRLFTLLRGGA